MENILKETNQFYRGFNSACSERIIAQNSLQKKINDFRTDKTKLFFLTELRKITIDNKIEHEKKCKIKNCPTSEYFNTGLFVIDEELDILNEYFQPEKTEKDSFSYEDMSNLNRKLNEILEKFQKLEFGQNIIFDEVDKVSEEIDILKQYSMNMDKNSWFQLAYVKFIGIGVTYGLEETIIKNIFDELLKQVDNNTSFLIP
jgi:hypothetical protein